MKCGVMKTGDLVKVNGATWVYPESTMKFWLGEPETFAPSSYVAPGCLGIYLTERTITWLNTFYQVVFPNLGPVWVRTDCIEVVKE